MKKKTQLFVEVKVQHQRVTGAGGDLAQAFETWTSSRLKGTPLVWFPCGGGEHRQDRGRLGCPAAQGGALSRV